MHNRLHLFDVIIEYTPEISYKVDHIPGELAHLYFKAFYLISFISKLMQNVNTMASVEMKETTPEKVLAVCHVLKVCLDSLASFPPYPLSVSLSSCSNHPPTTELSLHNMETPLTSPVSLLLSTMSPNLPITTQSLAISLAASPSAYSPMESSSMDQ